MTMLRIHYLQHWFGPFGQQRKVFTMPEQMSPTGPLTAAHQREVDALTWPVVDPWRRGRKG
jgi:hypothetical protein